MFLLHASSAPITKWESAGAPSTLSQLIHWSLGTFTSCGVSFFKSWLFIVIIQTVSISNWGENQGPLVITDLNLDDHRNIRIGWSCIKQPHVLTPERFNIPNPQPHHVAIVGHRALGNNVELKFVTTERVVRTLSSGDMMGVSCPYCYMCCRGYSICPIWYWR